MPYAKGVTWALTSRIESYQALFRGAGEPPDSTQAVMMITTWGEPAFSKAAITIADDMAKNFRIESAN